MSFNQNAVTIISNDGAKAYRYAEAGVRDALEKITRVITYNSADPGYFLNISASVACVAGVDGCAKVQVANPIPLISPKIITVTGYSGSSRRKIQVDAVYNNIFDITNVFWMEIKNFPTISTAQATSVASTTATLNGFTNPNGVAVSAWFRYSATAIARCSDTFGTKKPDTDISVTTDLDNPSAFSTGITGLTASTTYYYCAIGQHSGGSKVYGQVFTFATSS
ncbi:MAG: hypothetical protein A2846_00840 [Candidatus Doudnabacteria bacterium RIFCSPHIGHO2_01_FULL_49_9]|nr:MAG: hypothetical protein A2846_00840 [Candidatus Doudnabacteria bacterium RIFCSPHIGHO2_01_FULL_49_9]